MENPQLCNQTGVSNRDTHRSFFPTKAGGKASYFKFHPGLSLTPFEFSISFYLLPIKLFN